MKTLLYLITLTAIVSSCVSPTKPKNANKIKRDSLYIIHPVVKKHIKETPQGFIYPVLHKYGKKIEDFAPNNWEITDKVSGDLNKDSVEDVAIALSCKDSIKVNDGYRYPRILLIVFKIGDHYELKLQHNTLIENESTNEIGNTGVWNGDTFQSMEIINGMLKFHFEWDNLGVGTLIQYVVRYQSGDFYLIGATLQTGHHADTMTLDVNFSKRKYIYDDVDDETGFGGKYNEDHRKGKLPTNNLKKLIDVEAAGSLNILDYLP